MNFLRRDLGRRSSAPGAARNRAVAAAVLISGVARAAFFPASAQTPGVAGLVHDSIGRPIPGVEVRVLPNGPSVLTQSDGRFALASLPLGEQRLLVRRIGYTALLGHVTVVDSMLAIDLELDRMPQLLPAQLVSARQMRLPRVYERATKGLGVTLFAEDLVPYHGQGLTDLFGKFVPRFRGVLQAPARCGKEIYFVDGVRTPPLAWEMSEPPPTIGDFLTVEDIDAVEVLRSADFITEDFLLAGSLSEAGSLGGASGSVSRGTTASASGRARPSPSPVVASTSSGGGISRGAPLPGSQSLSTSCRRIVLIWTKYYQGQR